MGHRTKVGTFDNFGSEYACEFMECCKKQALGCVGSADYLTGNKCEFWRTEPDTVQGGGWAAVRALQTPQADREQRSSAPVLEARNTLFIGEYLGFNA